MLRWKFRCGSLRLGFGVWGLNPEFLSFGFGVRGVGLQALGFEELSRCAVRLFCSVQLYVSEFKMSGL